MSRAVEEPGPVKYRLGWGIEVVDLERAKAFAEVGEGWQPLIDVMFDVFETYCTEVHLTQVKEKFGGLRVYTGGVYVGTPKKGHMGPPDGDALIRILERLSYKICQQCGKPGHPRDGSWILTLCDECAKRLGYPEDDEEEEE